MSKTCKTMALLLMLAMLFSCIGVSAEGVFSEPLKVEEATAAPDAFESEEVLPDNAKLMSVIQDALNKDRTVSIYIAYEGDCVNFGDTVALYAVLEGYEDTEYTIQWQTGTDNENWEDIEGANAEKYEVIVTEDNYTDFYRVAVTLTGVEVDDDLL